jgi:tRNA-uridine 2-sulfurtransferase
MSGGVDSSTAAALLVEAGHDVVGVTLALLPEEAGRADGSAEGCCDEAGARRARAVADVLGIPHYTWNARDAFRAEVLEPFAHGYSVGETPNPCATCNDRIKFGWFLDRALATGADALATGHYARVMPAPGRDTGFRLSRGVDPERDQSYFLYRLGPGRLAAVVFPLGELTKTEVRAIAADRGLPAAEAPESREACFAPDGDYTRVIASRCPEALTPGDIVTLDGRVLGQHEGVARFTVGQRKGLALPDGPWFVVRLEPEVRRVVVGRAEDLEVHGIVAREPVWYGEPGPSAQLEGLLAQLRYRGRPIPARVDARRHAGTGDVAELRVELSEPVTGVAPGQAVVVYDGQTVLAGGVVSETA